MNQRLEKLLNFLVEVEKLKLVERIPYLSDRKRRENDAEHSWYLAMMFMTLEKEFDTKIDGLKVLKLITVHDLVEVYTGDDWAVIPEAKKVKQAQEIESAKKLFALLPSDLEQEFYDLWREYDLGETSEAKIAKALDKLSYSLQHSISKKICWHANHTAEQDIRQSRDYALPYLKNEKVLVEIFDHLMTKRLAEKDQFESVPEN